MPQLVDIPRPTLQRLPIYLRRLERAQQDGPQIVSSQELGQAADVPAAQVRKDLSYLGELGRPGIGYDVNHVATVLAEFLGLQNDKDAILVGAGRLGSALAADTGFERYGLRIVALFDNDPAKIGTTIADKQVFAIERLHDLVARLHIQIGVVTVPADQAQAVVDAMVAAGIEVIWNFAPGRLRVPAHVLLETEDLAARLATLSYHITRRKVG